MKINQLNSLQQINPIIVVTLSLILFFNSALWASPVSILEKAATQIMSTLKQHKSSLKNNPQIIYQAVAHYLLPLVDVEGMSRSVLGKAVWQKASRQEKSYFRQAFTQLVIKTYASPLAEYTDETIKFFPVNGAVNKRFIRVRSIIHRTNGKNISLNYSLVAKNHSWQIYDLSIEGVSLLQSFRTQFAQLLNNNSMAAVIKQMRAPKKIALNSSASFIVTTA